MQSQLESERSAVRTKLITLDRPDSSQLVDLHVYIIPKTVWRNHQNLAENEAIEQAISAGFVRVSPNLTINDLRQHIIDVCGEEDEFPKDFIYLRSVGRCLAKVKPQQETDLRVKNYRPPITVAPEIYVLEGHYDDDPLMTSNSKFHLSRESSIHLSLATPPQVTKAHQQDWIKSMAQSPQPLRTIYSSTVPSGEQQNSTTLNGSRVTSSSNLSRASSTLNARDLAKLREEQERLRLRQIELARQRREIEQEQEKRGLNEHEKQKSHIEDEQQKHGIDQEQQRHRIEQEQKKRETEQEEQRRRNELENERLKIEREQQRRKIEQEEQRRKIEQEEQRREKEFVTKQENLSKNQKEKEELAAIRIQKRYRGYQTRRKIKEQKKRELVAHEIERLQKEARELTRRKAEEEHAEEIKAHDVVKLSDRFEQIKTQRVQLEATREATIRRMQQLHAQIAVRRTEERDVWKQKYLTEKKKTIALEEKIQIASKDQPDANSQLEQAKIRLNNATKLREQAENECHLLKQELQQNHLNYKNTLEKHPLPKQMPLTQQQQPISFDTKLQY